LMRVEENIELRWENMLAGIPAHSTASSSL
jgi:hypothetical protein